MFNSEEARDARLEGILARLSLQPKKVADIIKMRALIDYLDVYFQDEVFPQAEQFRILINNSTHDEIREACDFIKTKPDGWKLLGINERNRLIRKNEKEVLDGLDAEDRAKAKSDAKAEKALVKRTLAALTLAEKVNAAKVLAASAPPPYCIAVRSPANAVRRPTNVSHLDPPPYD